MNTKEKTYTRKPCKCCGGNVYIKGDWNPETGKSTWECNNCFDITPRQIRQSKKQRELTEWLGI